MIRIGILGSDNSHAEVFARLCNEGVKGERIRGARVVALFGLDAKETTEVAEKAKIPTIVKRPKDMLEMVDAVIVVFRHGGLHYKYAAPFLKAGIPTFVDKPLACSVSHARKLIDLAKRHRVPLMSSSSLRYGPLVDAFRKEVQGIGKIRGGNLTGRGSARSPYGGIFFYGVHSVQMMLEIFGNKVKSVRATEHDGSAVALIDYKDGGVITLNIMDGSNVQFTAAAYGTKGVLATDKKGLQSSYIYIMKMLKTGKPPVPYKDVLLSTRILDAMQKSMDRDGKAIVLK